MDMPFELAHLPAELFNDLCRSVFLSEFLNKSELVGCIDFSVVLLYYHIVVGRVMNQTFVGESYHYFFLEDRYDTYFSRRLKKNVTEKQFQSPTESNRKYISRSLEDYPNFFVFFFCFISDNICPGKEEMLCMKKYVI